MAERLFVTDKDAVQCYLKCCVEDAYNGRYPGTIELVPPRPNSSTTFWVMLETYLRMQENSPIEIKIRTLTNPQTFLIEFKEGGKIHLIPTVATRRLASI